LAITKSTKVKQKKTLFGNCMPTKLIRNRRVGR